MVPVAFGVLVIGSPTGILIGSGAGGYCMDSSSPTIESNPITTNSAAVPSGFFIDDFTDKSKIVTHEGLVVDTDLGEVKLGQPIVDSERSHDCFMSGFSWNFRPCVLESISFDAAVENPIWGTIEWHEQLPDKTDIHMQTNVSSDNTTWDGWLSKGMVSFSFDDASVSAYDNAFPILRTYSFPGVAYVITDYIEEAERGNEHFMTLSQLHEMEDAGWEIGGHTKSHPRLDQLSEDELRDEIGGSYQYLKNNHFNVRSMAYPWCIHNADVIKIASEYFEFARGCQIDPLAFDYPVYGKYSLSCFVADTLSDLEALVDRAANNKKWVIFLFHWVDPHDDILEPLAQYVSSKDVDVVTVAEGMDRMVYSDSDGTQISSANKRYIKYRAIFYSHDEQNTPVLSKVTIRIVDAKKYPSWDVSQNGIVNIFDLVLVSLGVIGRPLGLNADVNGDGKVDIIDLILVGQHFGEIYLSASPSTNVWSFDAKYLPVLVEIYNTIEDSPNSDIDLLATKLLLHRLIFNARISKTEAFQNYPNPFNPETWIPYQLAENSEVTIRIYSSIGQLIRILDLGYREAGLCMTRDAAAYWDGKTDAGERVSSGVYFYNIQAGNYSATKKMIVGQ